MCLPNAHGRCQDRQTAIIIGSIDARHIERTPCTHVSGIAVDVYRYAMHPRSCAYIDASPCAIRHASIDRKHVLTPHAGLTAGLGVPLVSSACSSAFRIWFSTTAALRSLAAPAIWESSIAFWF